MLKWRKLIASKMLTILMSLFQSTENKIKQIQEVSSWITIVWHLIGDQIPRNPGFNTCIFLDSDEIDRAFEDLISQELSFVQKGYKDGLNTGITKHCNEGYKLGLQKGSEVGSKIGSYRGFALIALKHLNEEAILSKLSPKKQKCIKILGKLLKSTEEFPSTNPHATISGRFWYVTKPAI